MPTEPHLPATGVDPLTEVLHNLRLSGSLYCSAELRAPWGITFPPLEGVMMLQIVTEGRVRIEVDGVEPRELVAGSLALLPRGAGHVARSSAAARLVPLSQVPVTSVSEHYETARLGADGELTRATYAVLRFDHVAARRLVELLPPLVVVDALDAERADWIAAILGVVAREARRPRPGGETIITRLADVLVVETIRRWLERDATEHGWLAALRDPQIGRALSAVHRAPAHDWTLPLLAKAAGMSRSRFAERFGQLVGEPPMAYLADWRLRFARTLLCQTNGTLAEVATQVGYRSEAAFGRAFKRLFGVSPGKLRASSRRAEATRSVL